MFHPPDSLTLTTSSRGDIVEVSVQGEHTDIKGTTTHAMANLLYAHLLKSPSFMTTCTKLQMDVYVNKHQDNV